MLKIAYKDDYNAMLKRCEGAGSSVSSALIRIMTSHFVAPLVNVQNLVFVNGDFAFSVHAGMAMYKMWSTVQHIHR